MRAPIIVFAYNRVDHLKDTLQSLANNFHVEEYELFIYSDGAKNSKTENQVLQVRQYICEFIDNNPFKRVSVVHAVENKGLACSVIEAVTDIINIYGKAIVVEDDLVVSRDFLVYMDEALDYYRNNSQIWSISGYTARIPYLDMYEHDVYLSYRGSSWGWGTWSDRWNRVDWNVSDYEELKNSKSRIRKLNRGGEDMFRMLTRQMNGQINSWAIRWCYQQSKEDMYTIFPKYSKVVNRGLDGSGEHCSSTERYDTELVECKIEFCNPPIDRKMFKAFRELYSSKLTLMDKLKIQIKKIIGIPL